MSRDWENQADEATHNCYGMYAESCEHCTSVQGMSAKIEA